GPPAEQDMREVGLPAPDRRAVPGGCAPCPQPRVARACCAQISNLGPAGRALLVRFGLDIRRAEGRGGRGKACQACRWVSRRRGCGCATGPTGCSMRCRCGSCLRRPTDRPRCVRGGCRWCRCWTNRTAAGARGVWPRRPHRQGTTRNGGGTEVGEASEV